MFSDNFQKSFDKKGNTNSASLKKKYFQKPDQIISHVNRPLCLKYPQLCITN